MWKKLQKKHRQHPEEEFRYQDVELTRGGRRSTQAVTTRMVECLDRCESLEVDIKELEYFLLASNEQRVDIRHSALHARGDRHQQLFYTFGLQGHVGGECSSSG